MSSELEAVVQRNQRATMAADLRARFAARRSWLWWRAELCRAISGLPLSDVALLVRHAEHLRSARERKG